MKSTNTLLRKLILILLITLSWRGASADDGPMAFLREKYDDLPPVGKFATAAAIGFTGSKVAIKTIVTTAKVAGAVIILSEVLHVSGVMDEMPSYIDDQLSQVNGLKERVLLGASQFRTGFRNQLQKEKMAALGFASGAFVAMIM